MAATNDVVVMYYDGTKYVPITSVLSYTVGSTTLAVQTGKHFALPSGTNFGVFGKTPITQPTSSDEAALGAATTVGGNTGTAGAGLSLIGATNGGDVSGAIMNDLLALRDDVAAAYILINRLRTDLVDLGLIKGSA